MKFVKVNYHLNQTYKVEDSALIQMVKGAIKEIKGINLIESEIKIAKNNLGYKVKLVVEKDEKIGYEAACKSIQDSIESYSINLIEAKPENIQITFN